MSPDAKSNSIVYAPGADNISAVCVRMPTKYMNLDYAAGKENNHKVCVRIKKCMVIDYALAERG